MSTTFEHSTLTTKENISVFVCTEKSGGGLTVFQVGVFLFSRSDLDVPVSLRTFLRKNVYTATHQLDGKIILPKSKLICFYIWKCSDAIFRTVDAIKNETVRNGARTLMKKLVQEIREAIPDNMINKV